jgi:hypothetical protein
LVEPLVLVLLPFDLVDLILDKTNDLINNIRVDLSTSQIFKVLVVEDNRINQLVTKKIMEKNRSGNTNYHSRGGKLFKRLHIFLT